MSRKLVIRFAASAALAALVTFGLFLLLESVVSMAEAELSEDRSVRLPEFIRHNRETPVQTKKRELPERLTVDNQPAPPSLKLDSHAATAEVGLQIRAPAPTFTDKSVKLTGGLHVGPTASDRGSSALVRIRPLYPRSAAQRRIEGWVIVKFDITETGAVKNPKVVEARPRNVFDQAALDTIKKWKYRPKVQGGVPVADYGKTVKLVFELDQ